MILSCCILCFHLYLVSGTPFFRLIGYEIVADTLSTVTVATEEDCASQCVAATSPACIGVLFLGSSGECSLLYNIRNIIESPDACNYYVYDRTNETTKYEVPASFSDIEKLIYANSYLNELACPQSTTDEIIYCTIAVTATTCNEYSSIFEPVYNGTKCQLKVYRPPWICLNRNREVYLWNASATEGFCYYRCPTTAGRYLNNSYNVGMYIQVCDDLSSTAHMVTICSAEENQFIATLEGDRWHPIGLYRDGDISTWKWNNGETCPYRNWTTTYPKFDYANEVVLFYKGSFWNKAFTDYTCSTAECTYMYCEDKAYPLLEYGNTCSTLDSCEQL